MKSRLAREHIVSEVCLSSVVDPAEACGNTGGG